MKRVGDVRGSVVRVLRAVRCVGRESKRVRRRRLVVSDAGIGRGSGAAKVMGGACCVAVAASARRRAGLVVNPRRSERRYYGHSVGPGARGVVFQGRGRSADARRLPDDVRCRHAAAQGVSVGWADVIG